MKLMVDGVAARIAEAMGAVAILLWLKRAVPGGRIDMPLDTRWMSWLILATVASWLVITQRLRVQGAQGNSPSPATSPRDIECERFPDQCPCTTELGKGVT